MRKETESSTLRTEQSDWMDTESGMEQVRQNLYERTVGTKKQILERLICPLHH